MIKFFERHWQRRLERFYQKNHWHLVLDLSLSLIVILLAASTISLYFYQPIFSEPTTWFQSRSELDLKNPPLQLIFSVAETNLKITEGALLNIDLQNNGQAAIKNLTLTLTTTNPNFSLVSLEPFLAYPNLKIDGPVLSLSNIPARGKVSFSVKAFFVAKDPRLKKINWQAQGAYFFSGQTVKDVWPLLELKLRSELTALASAYYNSPQGDQLGVGPLPPLVGLPTTYWLFFEAKSDGDFQDFVMSAKLPKEVELTGNRSVLAGDFKYNTSTRQILWQIKELKADSSSYRVGFEVRLIPTALQVGQPAPLITNIKYYGQDALAATVTSQELKAVTTDLDLDRINQGNGRVVNQ